MTKNYTQLSLVQRYQIEAFYKAGMNQKFIAVQVGVHPSTISRELNRNIASRGRTAGLYSAERAQKKAQARHEENPKLIKFDTKLKETAAAMLIEKKWSPELISRSGDCPVSHEIIYRWIWGCKHGNKQREKKFKKFYKHLKHGRRRRTLGNRKDNRGVIPDRIPISKRPKIVEQRSRLGDVEVDLMIGKNHKYSLLVMTDRATLHTRLKKLPGKQAHDVNKAMVETLKKNPYPIKTLTFDNDKAFSEHFAIGKILRAYTFFTRPYTSQDKGTVEYRIGLVRRFYPKKTDLAHVSDDEILRVEQLLNDRLVRKFKYKSPK